MVFVETEGKIGHRWYLWVFHSESVIHFVLGPPRSANVLIAELSDSDGEIVICDRYAAYKKLARLFEKIIPHQRLDFLKLANAHPALSGWAFSWIEQIDLLHHLNGWRLEVLRSDPAQWVERHQALRQAIEQMAVRRAAELADPALKAPARKVLQRMQKHRSGVTVLVDHHEVPMDSNIAKQDQRTPVVARKNYYGLLRLWEWVVRRLGGPGVQPADDDALVGDQSPHVADGLSGSLRRERHQPPADLSAFLSWAMDAKRLA